MSESNESQKPLDFDLRTRIANIVVDHQLQYGDCYCGERFQAAQPWGLHVADAVIRELGLRREFHESRIVTNEHGATYRIKGGYRWITDWKVDDE